MTDKPTIRVLFLEDSLVQAAMIQEHLKDTRFAHFEVETAGRLSAALELLSKKDFDVALIDLQLPDAKGKEIFDKIHQQKSDLPVVILTGTFEEEVGLSTLKWGVQDFLTKDQGSSPAIIRAIRYSIERKKVEDILQKKIGELERMNDIMMTREEKILELKGELKRLRGETK